MIRYRKETGLFSAGGWSFKRSFIPRSITNFNKNVRCPDNKEKFGALCYPNSI